MLLGITIMKRFRPGSVKLALILVVIAPLCVGLALRRAGGPCDYVAQAGLLALMIGLPFCTPRQSGFAKQFGLFCLVGLAWGCWRMAYFDPVTSNDIPGISYLLAPAIMGGVSAFIFLFRKRPDGGDAQRIP